MGIAYRLDPTLRCTFVVWHGVVTTDDWDAQFTRLSTDRDYPPGPLVLTDLRTATGPSEFPHGAVQDMAERWASHRALAPQWAILPNGAWSLGAEFGDHLMRERPGLRIIQFNGLHTACTWLGVNARDAQTIMDELRNEVGGEPIVEPT